jgi:hypothetical protein
MSRTAILIAALLVPAVTLAQSESISRTIEHDIVIRSPFPCQIPGLFILIAMELKVPAGVEGVPEQCPDGTAPVKVTGRTSLRGMTVREALDTLVRFDPRYRWGESDGVIVLRPIAAWENRDHFLHGSVPEFVVSNDDIAGALAAVLTALGPWRVPGGWQTPHDDRRFSVTLGATSIYEALNAIVKAHGEVAWRVSYCQPPTLLEHATIGFFGVDGTTGNWALSHHPVFLRRPGGTTYDACRSAR